MSSNAAGAPRSASRRRWCGSVWNDEPEDAELVIVSKRVDDPQGETDYTPDFWPE